MSVRQTISTFPVPVSSVFIWAGKSNIPLPNGYLECLGTAISRTTYHELFALIGTTYGAGDGTTTFNLPNLNGTFLSAGDDAGVVIPPSTGTTTSGSFTLSSANIPSFNLTYNGSTFTASTSWTQQTKSSSDEYSVNDSGSPEMPNTDIPDSNAVVCSLAGGSVSFAGTNTAVAYTATTTGFAPAFKNLRYMIKAWGNTLLSSPPPIPSPIPAPTPPQPTPTQPYANIPSLSGVII
jgi:microcystin-dependent protein